MSKQIKAIDRVRKNSRIDNGIQKLFQRFIRKKELKFMKDYELFEHCTDQN